jgi:hypothetical protein
MIEKCPRCGGELRSKLDEEWGDDCGAIEGEEGE